MTQPAEKRAEHTPGPWTLNEWNHVVDASGEEVCFRGLAGLMTGSKDEIAEADANTRLVIAALDTAAARDRLQAANAVLLAGLEELETFAPWGGRTQKDIWAFQKWVQKIATTTVAKAKEPTP